MHHRGFTLIELMVAVAVVGILMTIAAPSIGYTLRQAELRRVLDYADKLKPAIELHYVLNQRLPANNEAAGLPAPAKLIANRIREVTLVDGALHLALGHRVSGGLAGTTLTVRPVVVEGSPSSPIDWICGFAEPVPGMRAGGENRTDIDPESLPGRCR